MKSQGVGEERLWPVVVPLSGQIVYLISRVGSFTSQFWVEHYGLSLGLVSTVPVVGI